MNTTRKAMRLPEEVPEIPYKPMIILVRLENGEQREMTVDEYVTLENAKFIRTVGGGNLYDFRKMMQKELSKFLVLPE